MKHLSILTFEKALSTSVVQIRELFTIADLFWRKSHDKGAENKIQIDIVTLDGNSVTSFCGTPLMATAACRQVESTDLIMISGIWEDVDQMLDINRGAIPWIIEHHKNGAALSTVSTGSFLLAETGLLDGKEATTYWSVVNLFRQKYPKVKLQPQKMITMADNIYCCTGPNSAMGMVIHLIEHVYDIDVAQRVEKYYMVDSSMMYLSADISFIGQKFHEDEQVLAVQQWLENNFSSGFLIREIAIQFGMSLRNLTRRFKQATGESISTYLHRYRIEIAKKLLKSSDHNIQEIAHQIGYEDMSNFYDIFKKHTSVTPKIYRQKSKSSR